MAIRGRGRPKLLPLAQIKMRNAAELLKEDKPDRGNSLKGLQQRYAEKLKREKIYV